MKKKPDLGWSILMDLLVDDRKSKWKQHEKALKRR
jgi:hypothetical protein